MNLYHYYDKTIGPLRTSDYMAKRRYYEDILRKEFQKKGGMIKRYLQYYIHT